MEMSEQVKSKGLLLLTNVRCSHLYVFDTYKGKPSPQNPNPMPVYKGDFLMTADHPDVARVAQAIEAIGASHAWKKNLTWEQVKAKCKAMDQFPLKRGDISQPGSPEYAGLLFVKANNKKPVSIYDADRSILTPRDGRPYSGCYVNATIDIYAQDNEWGQRINATLTGVQFIRHAPAFGGGAAPASADEFPVIAASADAPPPFAGSDPLAGLI
jgi:hypothetical protein